MKSREQTRTAAWTGWLPLLVLPLTAIFIRNSVLPWQFMWLLAIAIYAGLKFLTWWKARNQVPHAAWRSAAYLLAWPGMDAESFLDASQPVIPPRGRDWFWAFCLTTLGAILLWICARIVPAEPLLQGWIGMLGLILLLHFGSFRIAALCWQKNGVDAKPIMCSPLQSTSLSEFWGKRWNLGFRQLSYDLVFRPLKKNWGAGTAGFLVFLVSGMIHDLVISLPARGGYGLPTAYFLLQGVGVAAERSAFGKELGLRKGFRGWLFVIVFTVGPVFWLFHPPFVLRVIVPFMKAIHAL